MAEKPYQWADGAVLEDHSRRKHKILREYFFNYLTVRCQIAQMERFRLAVVDGFAGGGKYDCGTSGSPLIFVEELKHAVEAVNAPPEFMAGKQLIAKRTPVDAEKLADASVSMKEVAA